MLHATPPTFVCRTMQTSPAPEPEEDDFDEVGRLIIDESQ